MREAIAPHTEVMVEHGEGVRDLHSIHTTAKIASSTDESSTLIHDRGRMFTKWQRR